MKLSCSQKTITIIKGNFIKKYDFYYLNCFHSFRTKSRLEYRQRVGVKKYFCNVIIPSDDTKTLEFNQYQKYDKATFIVYVDIEFLIEMTDGSKNNPENSSTTKVRKHIPSGFPVTKMLSFRSIENKHDVYRCKDCMKNICESLREHAMKMIGYKKQKMKLLKKKRQKLYEKLKICCICKKKFEN